MVRPVGEERGAGASDVRAGRVGALTRVAAEEAEGGLAAASIDPLAGRRGVEGEADELAIVEGAAAFDSDGVHAGTVTVPF